MEYVQHVADEPACALLHHFHEERTGITSRRRDDVIQTGRKIIRFVLFCAGGDVFT